MMEEIIKTQFRHTSGESNNVIYVLTITCNIHKHDGMEKKKSEEVGHGCI